MNKVIVLQARLSSSRFPSKVLADLSGKSVIAHVIERLLSTNRANAVCVAMPVDGSEDPLAEVLASLPVTVVRGSQHDVLGRYIQAAYETRADIIVRATADNPLISVEEIERQLVALESNPEIEYIITEGYPLGVTPECFRLKTLEKLDYLARHAQMREHVTLYARKNPGPFAAETLLAPPELCAPEIRLTLDTRRDYKLFQAIYGELYHKGCLVDLADVLTLIRSRSDLLELSKERVALQATA